MWSGRRRFRPGLDGADNAQLESAASGRRRGDSNKTTFNLQTARRPIPLVGRPQNNKIFQWTAQSDSNQLSIRLLTWRRLKLDPGAGCPSAECHFPPAAATAAVSAVSAARVPPEATRPANRFSSHASRRPRVALEPERGPRRRRHRQQVAALGEPLQWRPASGRQPHRPSRWRRTMQIGRPVGRPARGSSSPAESRHLLPPAQPWKGPARHSRGANQFVGGRPTSRGRRFSTARTGGS